MAVFNIRATLQALQSHLTASGYYPGGAEIGELKIPPGEAITAAIFMNAVTTEMLTINTVRETHTVTVRLYKNMLDKPEQETEFALAEAAALTTEDFLGDLQMGGEIFTVDVSNTTLTETWGYLDVGGVMFRIVDLIVPLVVNNTVTLAS